jgi:hypothetical protein
MADDEEKSLDAVQKIVKKAQKRKWRERRGSNP